MVYIFANLKFNGKHPKYGIKIINSKSNININKSEIEHPKSDIK
jgi:hypothetical protein